MRTPHLGNPQVLPFDGRTRGDVTKVLFRLRLRRLCVDIAGDSDDSIGCTVVILEPLMYIIQGGSIQVLHRAYHRP